MSARKRIPGSFSELFANAVQYAEIPDDATIESMIKAAVEELKSTLRASLKESLAKAGLGGLALF